MSSSSTIFTESCFLFLSFPSSRFNSLSQDVLIQRMLTPSLTTTLETGLAEPTQDEITSTLLVDTTNELLQLRSIQGMKLHDQSQLLLPRFEIQSRSTISSPLPLLFFPFRLSYQPRNIIQFISTPKNISILRDFQVTKTTSLIYNQPSKHRVSNTKPKKKSFPSVFSSLSILLSSGSPRTFFLSISHLLPNLSLVKLLVDRLFIHPRSSLPFRTIFSRLHSGLSFNLLSPFPSFGDSC